MTAITATAEPDTASVTLQITGAANGVPTITRTDRNGTATVRLRRNETVIGGDLSTEDYEPALTGPLSYTVTDAAGVAASVVLAAGLAVSVPWLSHPALPALNTPVAVADDDPSWPNRSTRHDVYGREDPVFTTQPQGFATGTLVLACDTWAELQAARAVYRSGVPVLLRVPCATDRDHYHVGSLSTAPRVTGDWTRPFTLTVQYEDVRLPLGFLQGSADWTYADGTALTPSYAADLARFPSYADRKAGPG